MDKTSTGRDAGFRSLHYFVDEIIVKLGHVLTIGALYFDLAARMVVGSEQVRARSRGNDVRNWGI